jgi:hypothetical protein
LTQVTVTLGGFVFADFEVPDKIPAGGEQMLAIHKLIGGQRVVDSLGRDDLALEWSGRFVGTNALSRAQQLDAMRVAGAAIDLTWSELSYSVVIKRFVFDFEADYLIPYSITCEVVSDTANPSGDGSGDSLDDQMSDDMGTASDLGDSIGDATLSGQLSDLSDAISTVSSFTNAPSALIATVLAPLGAAQTQVSSLISTAEAVTSSDLGAAPSTIAANLLSQSTAASALPDLYACGSVLSRMASNIGAAGLSGASQTMVGGDLSFVAAQVYGDATGWTAIARANGLTDPVLEGINTITVPPVSDGADGVLIQ